MTKNTGICRSRQTRITREQAGTVSGAPSMNRGDFSQRKPFCINESCENFLPEEKRGYKKKTTGTKPDGKKKTAKKAAK